MGAVGACGTSCLSPGAALPRSFNPRSRLPEQTDGGPSRGACATIRQPTHRSLVLGHGLVIGTLCFTDINCLWSNNSLYDKKLKYFDSCYRWSRTWLNCWSFFLQVLQTLGTETYRPSSASQCVAGIACAEIPMNQWPELIPQLVANVTNQHSTEHMKESTLEAIGYICQDIVSISSWIFCSSFLLVFLLNFIVSRCLGNKLEHIIQAGL